MRRLVLTTTVLGLLACQRVPVALDGAPVPDVGPDGPPSLPWVSTYAGAGCGVPWGDGSRLQAAMDYPGDITLHPATGDIYFLDGIWVRVVRGDQIVTFAGPVNGSRQKDGPALETSFWDLAALAVATNGTVFVAERERVRKIQGGMVTTLAGVHNENAHVDGPAETARFVKIRALAIDLDGGLLIADVYGIRKLKDGVVSTIAGSGPWSGYPTAGGDGPATEVQLKGTSGLLVESDGILFGEGHRIRRLHNGQIETLAGTTQDTRFPKPRDGPLDQALFVAIHTLRRRGGRLYFIDDPNRIRMIENDRVTTINPLTQPGMRDGPLDQALFDRPWALALFGSTGLLVSDKMNCRLRMIQFAE